MTPALASGRHQHTLAAVDGLAPGYAQHCPGGLPDDALAVIAARRSILVRHQPVDDDHDDAVCDASGGTWPCPEYVAAAADQLDERGPA